MDFLHQRPSALALEWVEHLLGGEAHVVAWRRMTGGIMSAVHRLSVDCHGRRYQLILRQYQHASADSGNLVRREAAMLRAVQAADLPAPELVGACAQGADCGGRPSLLMTRLPGQIHLTPEAPDDWLGQIACLAAAIHSARVDAPPFERWIDPGELAVPATATRPRLWRAVISELQQQRAVAVPGLIHRDFQHFNFLWRRGRLTGVVDWGMASTGPPGIDIGHCQLNLAVLFGADWAERFRLAYEAETGRAVDPWWTLHAMAAYDDAWRDFIPVQVAGRVAVDTDGMTSRVEELLEATLRRL